MCSSERWLALLQSLLHSPHPPSLHYSPQPPLEARRVPQRQGGGLCITRALHFDGEARRPCSSAAPRRTSPPYAPRPQYIAVMRILYLYLTRTTFAIFDCCEKAEGLLMCV